MSEIQNRKTNAEFKDQTQHFSTLKPICLYRSARNNSTNSWVSFRKIISDKTPFIFYNRIALAR
ncbi:hypothetical protein LEP1GSC062_2756 [Leptospira alexanderi serovar Manhao 3 str. L 60]|uniref:Uncharacterized protein n=1 Tax=Leptospira alexanderi serovar Manhao 3 str. L 60 TaxID=1049759 RepID=V6I2T9_9LEPT|nr:hypothetical protein LEP1GSC062_2756 [Leptospira alexanderi serovar Manhao 3 str. L 60]